MPIVSVIIPAHDSASTISATIQSVLAQTFSDYEIIIVDDGSTDQTAHVIKQFGDQVTYIYQNNQERSAARNTGIRASSGEYIAFLDADDLWKPQKLEQQYQVAEKHLEVPLVYCQANFIDFYGQPSQIQGRQAIEEPATEIVICDRTRELFMGAIPRAGGSTAMLRRNALDQAGLFDITLNYGEDWDLWVRLAQIGPFAYIPEVLTLYRVSGWEKMLKREESEQLIEQNLRILDKAIKLWSGDDAEGKALYAQGIVTIYLRAALSNYQLGKSSRGSDYLAKATAIDPNISKRDRLFTIALDRAKQVQLDSDSYLPAVAFVRTMFSNLPASQAHFRNDYNEVICWLYVSGAFDAHWRGDKAGVRYYLSRAIRQSPPCLLNRGVVSIGVHSFLPGRRKAA